jgi:protein-S-isoprenylcysteine O-methyltransferase Ste14
MPPTYFIILLVLAVASYFVLNIAVLSAPFTYLGIIFIGFGVVMNIWSDSLFNKRKTPVSPFGSPTTLVIDGPFRISRNPMYVGMAAILLGVSIFTGSLITFVFPIIFYIIIRTQFIPIEEKNLEKKFGKTYDDYKSSVRRWI